VSTSRKHLCDLVVVVVGMVISNVDTMQRRMVRSFMVMSVFWADMGKTIPVNDQNMYETFLSAKDNWKSCSNYNVSELETDSFKSLCSLPTPDLSQEKITQNLQYNIAPLLCYSILHNVNAVCHPQAAQPSAKSSTPAKPTSDQFCESTTPLTLPDTCTHWLEDPEDTSKADCFLVNEVVGAVLKKKDFCKNKCLVPNPDDGKAPPTVNPLCEKLLDTSKILAEMPPQESADDKQEKSLSSNTPEVSAQAAPPGLTKSPSAKVEEAPEVEKEKEKKEKEKKTESEPKSGEEIIDSALNVSTLKSDVKPSADSVTKTKVALETSSNKSKVAAVDVTGRADLDNPDESSSNTNTTFQSYAKTNSKTTQTAAPEGIEAVNKTSMTTSDIDIESSASFTSPFEFDYSSDIDPAEEKTKVTEEDEKSKEISEDEEKDSKGGGIDADAEPLVGVEEKGKDKDEAVVEKDPVEDKKDVTESKVEPVLPDTQNNIVETKYEDNMKGGPEIDEQSSFFGYFILLSIVAIIAYLVFHNKQKILALVLEGRRRQGNRRRSGGREYRKLDSNLEDTMDPGKETSLRQVIY